MTIDPDKVREALANATEGPWRWEMNRHAKQVSLSGAGGDLTVMDFVRWGMSGAAARFWRWTGSPRIGDPKRADQLAAPIPSREHHEDWCADIDDPNATLIAMSPDLARAYLSKCEEVERLKRDAAELVKALEAHHQWHLNQDRDGEAWGVDLVDAYSESGLCEMTTAALAALRSELGDSHDQK